MHLVRFLLRPFGYLAFVLALAALSFAAWLLGDKHPLGFFAGRLARPMWRYPEITRKGILMAWLIWAMLFGIAISPSDPIHTYWDEIALGILALVILARRYALARRAGH